MWKCRKEQKKIVFGKRYEKRLDMTENVLYGMTVFSESS